MPTARHLENGVSTYFAYDAARRLTAIEHRRGLDLIARLAYTFDSMGNRRSKTTSAIASLLEQYRYDAGDQLVEARYQGSGAQRTVTYQYDPAGNRQRVTDGGRAVTYAVNPDNAYTQVGGAAASLDANGNHAGTAGGAAYTYDAQNRLLTATVGGVTTRFTYDPRNRVAVRTTGGRALHLTYGGWNLLEERDGAGDLQQVYVHGARIDEMVAKITPAGSAYYLCDALGSTVALTGATGEVLERYLYDAFGAAQIFDSSFSPLPSSLQNNRFLFAGREWLAEAGLYDYRNRVYSPAHGRFLQTDPIRFAAGDVNIYRYVANNPANLFDPLGLEWYNPASWNWQKIGSAFEGRFGPGLGLDAKAKLGPFEAKAGAKYSLGGWGNLGGDGGMFINGEANLISLKAGNHQVGLGASYNLKTGNCPETDLPYYNESGGPLLGYKYGQAGSKSTDWTKVGLSANLALFDLGVSVSFGKIWQGITE